MPELPEVETVRKGLELYLGNFQITKVLVCRERVISSPGGSALFTKMLPGNFIGNWLRRGKYLLTPLGTKRIFKPTTSTAVNDGGWWGVHLRMTGHFQWFSSKSEPCSHTRVRFWNDKGEELRFVDTRGFGQMWWVPPEYSPDSIITGLKKLGPEPFSKGFNAKYLKERLSGSKRAIKTALLDQNIVAGPGNIYADESLFAAKINPNTPAGKLNTQQLGRICSSLIEVLNSSIGVGGTTFSDFRDLEGLNGNYGSQAYVYRRTGQDCRICGTSIKRKKLCGRSTHWCPKCQA